MPAAHSVDDDMPTQCAANALMKSSLTNSLAKALTVVKVSASKRFLGSLLGTGQEEKTTGKTKWLT